MLKVIDRLLTKSGLCITVQGRQDIKIGSVLKDCNGGLVHVKGVGMGGNLKNTELFVDNTGLTIGDELFIIVDDKAL